LTSIVPSPSTRKLLEKASRKYNEEITPEGVEYLTARGITEEAIEEFRLGVVVDPVPGHENYRGCLSIPYLSSHGVITIRFRKLTGDGPKYMTLPGDTTRLYNVKALERGTRSICLSEGELDAVVSEICEMPCVALPGATSWKRIFRRLLGQYEWVYLLQDDDQAGKDMATALSKELPNLRPIVMSGGDVTSFFLEHGKEELRRKVIDS